MNIGSLSFDQMKPKQISVDQMETRTTTVTTQIFSDIDQGLIQFSCML